MPSLTLPPKAGGRVPGSEEAEDLRQAAGEGEARAAGTLVRSANGRAFAKGAKALFPVMLAMALLPGGRRVACVPLATRPAGGGVVGGGRGG